MIEKCERVAMGYMVNRVETVKRGQMGEMCERAEAFRVVKRSNMDEMVQRDEMSDISKSGWVAEMCE